MQAYILQEIGRNILESQSQSQSQSPTTTPSRTPRSPNKLLSTSKFKPKKPALRYKERHPEASMEIDHDNEHMSDFEVEDEDMDTDSEYIIDTYIRLPAEDIQDTGREINFGLLVLDSQPDIDEFYRDEKEEEEEDEDDVEEDENGEFDASHMRLFNFSPFFLYTLSCFRSLLLHYHRVFFYLFS
ncbi:hypothetical protein ACMFMF_006886 [Clarireedia jacksonii]